MGAPTIRTSDLATQTSRRALLSLLLVASLSLNAGCLSSTIIPDDGRPLVVCTTQMVGDFIRRIGGDHFHVHVLMGPDIDPHLYKASPSDIYRMTRAQMIVYSGLHLEGNLQPALEAMKKTRPTFAVTEDLHDHHQNKLIHLGEDLYDPHIWHDVALWTQAGEYTAQKLIELYPEHKDEFEKNWQTYKAELVQLHHETREQLAKLPVKIFVTGHDAFSYFGRTYGLEVHPVQGVSTENEASVSKINQLVNLIVEKKVPAIFVESTLNDRNLRALIEGATHRGHRITIGGTLYSDATGPVGSGAESYEGMIRANVHTIVNALQPKS